MNITGHDLIRHVQLSVQVWQLSPVSDLVLDRVSQQDMVQQQLDAIRVQKEISCQPCF